jgi:hypothetical protein
VSDWLPDLLTGAGVIALGSAAYMAGGLIGLLVYFGVVCLIGAGVLIWKRTR